MIFLEVALYVINRVLSIRRKLEKDIVQKLKSIYRKNNLITHIEIGKNFDFNLYQDEEYNGKELLTLYKNLGDSEFTNLIGTNLEKFNRLIDKLDKAKTDTMDEEYINLDKQNLDEREISEFGKGIANIIHTNIHNGDTAIGYYCCYGER